MDPAAVQLDQRPHDRQAEAGAAMARAAGVALEAVEHAVEHLGGNAAAAVADLEHDLVAAAHRRQRHRLPRLGEADRVGEQVEQHLADAPAVGAQRADVVGGDDAQLDLRIR